MQARYDKVFVYAARADGTGASHEFLQVRDSGGNGRGGQWRSISGLIRAEEPAWRTAVRLLFEQAELQAAQLYRVDGLASFYSREDETIWHCAQFLALVERSEVPSAKGASR